MTAPVWFAAPPEVHSALLSAGPGPGPLLAAAAAWSGLSAEYSSAAAELTALLGGAQGGSWEGPSAEQYVAAHLPYLAWLTQASVNSAGVAAQQETAAAAYSAALATMPTLAELAANHVVHGALIATNFFGINTIPIALNEADYARMWVQAATSMSTYQAIAGTALASAPRTSAAPFVLTPGVGEAGAASASVLQVGTQALATDAGSALDSSGIISDLIKFYADFLDQLFGPIIDFLMDPIGNFTALITDFLTNPAQALVTWFPLLFAVGYQAILQPIGWTTWSLIAAAPALIPLLIVFAAIGANQLLAPVLPPSEAVVPVAPQSIGARAEQPSWPVASAAPTAAAPATAPAPAPAPGTVAPGTAPVAAGAEGFGYAVRGDSPDGGVGPTLNEGTGARAPAAELAAAAALAAPASARERRKARRSRGAEVKDRGYRDEYMTLDDGPAAPPEAPVRPTTRASAQGAGAMGVSGGFAGTADTGTHAAGLTTLPGAAFGDGPSEPMLPSTWEEDAPDPPDPN